MFEAGLAGGLDPAPDQWHCVDGAGRGVVLVVEARSELAASAAAAMAVQTASEASQESADETATDV